MAVATKVSVSMKVGDLRDALAKGMLVNQRTPLPIHSKSALTIVGGKATVVTQDTEKVVKVSFDATGPDMSCLIPRRMALKFLSGGDGQVMVEPTDAHTVTLTRQGFGKVALRDAGLFSNFKLPEVSNDLKWVKLDTKHFLRMLKYALPCAAIDESRPVLTAIALEDGRMAAADGFRLAVITSDRLEFGLGTKLNDKMQVTPIQILLPRLLAIVAMRAFAKEESIEFAIVKVAGKAQDMIFMRGGNTEIMGWATMGTFPVFDQLVPQSFDSRVSFSVPLMLQRLNMMDVMEDSGIVRFNFHKTQKQEDVAGILNQGGDIDVKYELEMPVKLEDGKESRIAFNWKYLVDLLKPFSVCNLELTSSASPGKFTGDIKELTYVLMPMFVQW